MQRKLCKGKCHIQFLRSKVHYVCVGNRTKTTGLISNMEKIQVSKGQRQI